MNEPVDFVAIVDPLLRLAELEHLLLLPVLGLPTRFESNSRHVMETVEQAFGGWRALDAADGSATESLRVRVVVSEGCEHGSRPVEVRYIAPDAARIIAQSAGSVAVSDPLRRESVAYVTSDLADDREHFRVAILEATTLALLAHFDRHPVHAAAIGRAGRAVLLLGASGAGKSTLAHTAHAAGIDVMSEDHVWVQLEPSLRIWGWPGHARLIVDGNGGKRVVPLSNSSGAGCYVAESAVVCVLARGATATLDRIDSDAVHRALMSDVAPGFDRFPARHRACSAALSRGGGWRLTLSPDPRDALPLLRRMLDESPDEVISDPSG